MTLNVEDGTGLTDADAFISLQFCDDYHQSQGNSTWQGDADVKEAAIRRATNFLSRSFSWHGTPLNGRSQALAWPRQNVIDRSGDEVPIDEVPREVKNATAEAALLELVSPGVLMPEIKNTNKKVREKAGEVEVQYSDRQSSPQQQRPTHFAIVDLLIGLHAPRNVSPISGSVTR